MTERHVCGAMARARAELGQRISFPGVADELRQLSGLRYWGLMLGENMVAGGFRHCPYCGGRLDGQRAAWRKRRQARLHWLYRRHLTSYDENAERYYQEDAGEVLSPSPIVRHIDVYVRRVKRGGAGVSVAGGAFLPTEGVGLEEDDQ